MHDQRQNGSIALHIDMPFPSAGLLKHHLLPGMILLPCAGLGDRSEVAKSFCLLVSKDFLNHTVTFLKKLHHLKLFYIAGFNFLKLKPAI